MKRVIPVLTLALVLCAGHALAFNMMAAAEVKSRLEAKTPMTLIDIQVAGDFDKHHLPGAIATYAYPVKSDQEQTQVGAVLPRLIANQDPVVVVCPRGKGGAERTYDYLKANGIAEDRLFILENGQEGWPYAELVSGR
jgi:thiosulfate/3-mercaptopyruvate sulfurtransferase